jgi:hypothetical protein
LSPGYRIINKSFLKRDTPRDDPVKWFIEGEPVDYEDGIPLVDEYGYHFVHTEAFANRGGELSGKIKASMDKSFSALGLSDNAATEGTISISLRNTPGPANIDIGIDGVFSVQIQLGPADFTDIVKGLSEGKELWVSLSDFNFRPLLVTDDSHHAHERYYWVPYTGVFNEIYNRLGGELGDSYLREPSASIGFSRFSLPNNANPIERRAQRATIGTHQVAENEPTTSDLIKLISEDLTNQQEVLFSLRRYFGVGNLLLLVVILILVLK